MARRFAIVCCFASVMGSACDLPGLFDKPAPERKAPAPSDAIAAIAAPPARPDPALIEAPAPPAAGREVNVPSGTLELGSASGTPGRNPAREADAISIAVGGFSIDALPYPNDPALPAKASLSRDEASQACATQGKRLCSEVEWERACKGATNATYPSSRDFDAALCAREPLHCASDLGVFALGTSGREWTLSHAGSADWDRIRSAVVRGAAADAEGVLHRCAARDAAAPESRSESLLFRCCRGEAASFAYPEQRDVAPFRTLDLNTEGARKLLAALPEAKPLAESFRLYKPGELGQTLAGTGRTPQNLSPWTVAASAFAWSPVRGEEIVILSGDTARGATLVAYYPQPDGSARFAGSYETKDEHTPIVVAYKADTRAELLFSTCWGCGGEGGAVRLDERARLRFVPR